MRGDRLCKLRQERNLSQRELGAIILVSGYTISAYEQDRCDPSDYLIGLIDQPLSYRRDANVVMLPRTLSEAQKNRLRAFLSSLEEMDWAGAEEEAEPAAVAAGV